MAQEQKPTPTTEGGASPTRKAVTDLVGGVIIFPVTAGSTDYFRAIEFSCVIAEQHVSENAVTGYPVETGFIIADHAIRQNRKLSLSIVMGNFMNSKEDALKSTNNKNTLLNCGLPYSDEATLVGTIQEAHEEFTSMVLEAKTCMISTIYGNYYNAVVTKYVTRQDINTSLVLQATLDLEDIYTVEIDKDAPAAVTVESVPETVETETQAVIEETTEKTKEADGKAEPSHYSGSDRTF